MILSKSFQFMNTINSLCKLTLKSYSIKNNIHSKCHIHSQRLNEQMYYEDTIKLTVLGKSLKFPSVWLRENCQCDQCFHRSAKSRILDWSNFNLNVQPTKVEENDNFVKITWDDGHSSEYEIDWLKFRSFHPEDQKKYSDNFYRPAKIPWRGEQFENVFTKYDYNRVLSSDNVLYDCLFNLSTYGVALIENTPDNEKAVDAIIDKIGFVKRTHYGDKYIVQNVVDTNNVAYLTSNLQMHTDLPYYEYCPGVNVLHCRVQTASEGGENLLADCHFVAKFMKEHHPKEYNILTSVEVEWSDIGVEDGNEFYKLHRSPVICLNVHGDIVYTKLSIPQRGSHFLGDVEQVKPWYRAHGLFLELSHRFAAKFRTNAGKILVFDNSRMLHGRNAYKDTGNNVRQVIGAFIDWDEIYSRLRCLKAKLEGNVPTN